LNAPDETFTGLLNVTVGATPASTFVAPPTGLVPVTVGGLSTVNEKLESAAIPVPTRSATCAATTVTVHVVPAGKLDVGVNVNVATPPGGDGLNVNASGVPLGHSSLNAPDATFTGLLNVTVGATPASTLVAPSTGVVLDTVGGESTAVTVTVTVPVAIPPCPSLAS
jgi:hypothetical protein